jgi:hypothetical protein
LPACAQVSTEYSSFKRDAEVKLGELEHERDQAREELQLAMVAGSVSPSGVVTACAFSAWWLCSAACLCSRHSVCLQRAAAERAAMRS